MKYFILIFLLFSYQLSHTQIQSGTLTFKAKEIKSPLDLDKIKEKSPENYDFFSNYIKKIQNTIPYLEFSLIFNQNESIYRNIETMESDNPALDINSTLTMVSGNGVFYNNQEENQKIKQIKHESTTYLIQEENNAIDWEIKNESKEILGYKVYKAVGQVLVNVNITSEVIAWFAPELPFQFGPAGYSNLPGLILEFEKDGYAQYAIDIQLKEKSTTIKSPTKGKTISPKDYYKEIMNNISFD